MKTSTAIRERPILFSAPMIRAILAGRKTMTRRVVKLTDGSGCGAGMACLSGRTATPLRDGVGLVWRPYGGSPEVPMPPHKMREFCPYGEKLWVREAYRVAKQHDSKPPRDLPHARGLTVMFEAGGSRAHDATGEYVNDDAYPASRPDWAGKLRPGMFLPRWASRITLEITDVRVERLQEISHEDALAEGCEGSRWVASSPYFAGPHTDDGELPQEEFQHLWDSINGKRVRKVIHGGVVQQHDKDHETPYSWDVNPWVWVWVIGFRRIEQESTS